MNRKQWKKVRQFAGFASKNWGERAHDAVYRFTKNDGRATRCALYGQPECLPHKMWLVNSSINHRTPGYMLLKKSAKRKPTPWLF